MTHEELFRDDDRMLAGIHAARDALRDVLSSEGLEREQRLEDQRSRVLNLLIHSYTFIQHRGHTADFTEYFNKANRPMTDEEMDEANRLLAADSIRSGSHD